MPKSKFLASVLTVAVASSLAVAPAQALQTTLKDSTCTVKLSAGEKADWDKATKQPNTVDENLIMPFKVKVTEAAAAKAEFDKQLANAQADVDIVKSRLDLDQYDTEELKKLDQGDVAVTAQLGKLANKYRDALDACAESKAYNSEKSKSTSETPWSQLNDATKNTLYGLLGLAAFTALAWIAKEVIPALPRLGIMIPGLPV
ncbi:hypothetical protein CPHO_09515 [Corynebacterium phocae]|uniref:Uncharacterized protein n=1 Tax=Corynebacterium phocae TaxID=161895 RepID=A0A1L7D4L5_9CORY|nr:hypothetical protein [Corynebacterium phocae]APT93084.1 hypothetical protein CPHO_09515 [Corynebacterium phocae]KAA8722386.1 hypothetical protein F4V58_08985 [Corynebacterium phocae]